MRPLAITLLLSFTFSVLSLKSFAQSKPQFAFPVDCQLDETCWIVSYPDVNPETEAEADFTCGPLTKDGHKGTDIALRSTYEMREGVAVLAARDGTVIRKRSSEPDISKSEDQIEAVRKAQKECGNGVLIDHGNELRSFYCHLKQNSIPVNIGQKVKAGDKIGEIGLSGETTFPHLHFAVTWERAHIDPFTSGPLSANCGTFKDNMWDPDIQYRPFALFDAGFDDARPDFGAITKGETGPQDVLPASTDTLAFWAGFYQAQPDDEITLTITGPKGDVFARRKVRIEKQRKGASYYYTGRRFDEPLPAGMYKGIFEIRRNGFPPARIERTISIKDAL